MLRPSLDSTERVTTNRIKMNGRGGELFVGYAVAARLNQWTLVDGVFSAPDAEIDRFWIDEPGSFSLRLRFGSALWTWRNVTVTCREPLTLVLDGSPETRRL